MTDDQIRDHAHLAALARNRRMELGLPLTDAHAKAAGISKGTWQRIEKGMPIRETNYVKIDAVLKWAPGSCIRALNGDDPIAVSDVPGDSGAHISLVPHEAIDGEVRDVVRLALIATAQGTTAEEIREMSERVVRDLRERGLI